MLNAATKCPQEIPGKAHGIIGINPIPASVPLPSEDPRSSIGPMACAGNSHKVMVQGLRSDLGGLNARSYHCLVL